MTLKEQRAKWEEGLNVRMVLAHEVDGGYDDKVLVVLTNPDYDPRTELERPEGSR